MGGGGNRGAALRNHGVGNRLRLGAGPVCQRDQYAVGVAHDKHALAPRLVGGRSHDLDPGGAQSRVLGIGIGHVEIEPVAPAIGCRDQFGRRAIEFVTQDRQLRAGRMRALLPSGSMTMA